MKTTLAETELGKVRANRESDKYLIDGHDFIDDRLIHEQIAAGRGADKSRIRDIIAKSLSIKRLDPDETAALLGVENSDLRQEMFAAARQVRDKVYGPRVVTFAPLYCSNYCVNSCLYCAFRCENSAQKRKALTIDEVRSEVRNLVNNGHKRLIVVYGEHPDSSADYMVETIRAIYDEQTDKGEIRRVNVNAAPLSVGDFRRVKEVGLGTYQVFQETYHHETYARMHPSGPKSDFRWRLYALHRAQEAGIDDVAIGALFGLYDWRFEVMGLLYHTMDLERCFNGVGPHTISFPRLEPAQKSKVASESPYRVSDEDFKTLIAVLRLSVPYTGMIVTARETAEIRRAAIEIGCTQTDASTRIGVGAYSEDYRKQEESRQQFRLGDTRELEEVVQDLARMGYMTSFCTAAYRCGRTGTKFMETAKAGAACSHLCIPNAILTFKEYLEDFASPATKQMGEKLIAERLEQLPENHKKFVADGLRRIAAGERDVRL
ncbi:MAG TPA: [FeFe] hydrogenase H-cluster radical SAM maturase HydG [Candidatus Brocadiia bacterium]|nr:[FeFe] hydrogenase H-cluster radical SAM maturase HydG [Candidatus Brocadiia bacterium]